MNAVRRKERIVMAVQSPDFSATQDGKVDMIREGRQMETLDRDQKWKAKCNCWAKMTSRYKLQGEGDHGKEEGALPLLCLIQVRWL